MGQFCVAISSISGSILEYQNHKMSLLHGFDGLHGFLGMVHMGLCVDSLK